MADDAAAYLAALTLPDLGPARLRRLLEAFGSLQAAALASDARLAEVEGVPPPVLGRFGARLDQALPDARRVVAAARSAGLTVVCWADTAYPAPLRADPANIAPVLFVEGELPPALQLPYPDVRSVAVVGTRKPIPEASAMARDLARVLAREGVVVVSGLAFGVDAAAHRGALEGARDVPSDARPTSRTGHRYRTAEWAAGPWPGATVAVLGGGHGHLYPAAHRALAHDILRTEGALVSQWPPDVAARPDHFLRRNRVIAGLSRVVVAVQAGARSGAVNTVLHALDQGRTALAVPAFPTESAFAGNLALLRDGATPCIDETDVLMHFSELTALADRVRTANRGADATAITATSGTAATPGTWLAAADATHPTARVRAALDGHGQQALDDVVARTGLAPADALRVLTRLELDGDVMRQPDGRYRLRLGAARRASGG